MKPLALLLLTSASLHALEPLPLMETVTVNRIDLVAPPDAIHTYMFKDENSYTETLKKMDEFFTELELAKAN